VSPTRAGRRDALNAARTRLARAVGGAQGSGELSRGAPPREELVNVLEFEEAAKSVLPAAAFAAIAGSDRSAFDRITFRPRMLIPTVDLDLGVDLLGARHFTPLLVGPVADQKRFHAEAERATARGASAANTTMILSSGSSLPVADILRETRTPTWYSVHADASGDARAQAQQAIAAGCTALCITVGARDDNGRSRLSGRIDWNAIDRLRKDITVPVVLKGVLSTDDAKAAVAKGVQGIVVSNYSGVGSPSPIEVLPSVAEVVNHRAAVLIDGSFRRGSDILKALVLGAQAVILARPVMWGLSAYGAVGVKTVIEMLQSDLGRHLAALGASNLKSLNRSHVRIHRR
jgi:4-hydroxymandelate oxidase